MPKAKPPRLAEPFILNLWASKDLAGYKGQSPADELPYEIQQIIFWSVKNIKLIKEMCKNSEMSLEEINKNIETALKKQDYFTYVLFSF